MLARFIATSGVLIDGLTKSRGLFKRIDCGTSKSEPEEAPQAGLAATAAAVSAVMGQSVRRDWHIKHSIYLHLCSRAGSSCAVRGTHDPPSQAHEIISSSLFSL